MKRGVNLMIAQKKKSNEILSKKRKLIKMKIRLNKLKMKIRKKQKWKWILNNPQKKLK